MNEDERKLARERMVQEFPELPRELVEEAFDRTEEYLADWERQLREHLAATPDDDEADGELPSWLTEPRSRRKQGERR
jgi:hypothetical protein